MGRARTSAIAMFAALALSSSLSAQQLIQCPDWKSLVEQERAVALRRGPPSKSFEQVVLASAPSTVATEARASGESRARASKSGSKPLSALKSGGSVSPAACPTYTVKAGDSLSKIARSKLGAAKRYPELAHLNGIKISAPLKVGQVLSMPCSAAGASPSAKASVKVNSVTPPQPKPVPLPVWRGKSGEYLTDVIRRWGKEAGYKVVKEGVDDWRLSVPVAVEGTFEEALQQVVKGFEGSGRPPGVSIYSNKVVKVGAP
jgi:LysM repeat protein